MNRGSFIINYHIPCSGNFPKVSKDTFFYMVIFFKRESEVLLKKDLTTGVSYLGKYFKMDDFWQLETFTFDVFQFFTTAILFQLLLFIM